MGHAVHNGANVFGHKQNIAAVFGSKHIGFVILVALGTKLIQNIICIPAGAPTSEAFNACGIILRYYLIGYIHISALKIILLLHA